MKTATLRDGRKAHVGTRVVFFWEPGDLATGEVVSIYRPLEQDQFSGSIILLWVRARGLMKSVPARHAWKEATP